MPDDFIQDSLNQGRERVDEALDYYDNLVLQDRPDREKEGLGNLRTALAASDGMTAQGQAEARRLADSLGMPQKVVAAAPERAREEVVFRRLSQDALLARWAAQDKENAALAREDADGLLTVFERVKDVGRAITHGVADLNRAGLGAAQAVTENIFGADSAAARWLQERQRWVEWARPQEVKVDSTVGQFAYDFVRSAPQQFLNIATALANPAAALYMMGAQILGGSYSELREQGVSPQRALSSGLANAALQAPLERLGLDRFMAVFRSTSLRDTLMRMGGAALAEGFTEYLQKAPETLTNLWGLAETKFKNQDDQIAWFANTFFDAQTLANMHREALYEGAIGAMWGLVGGGARTLASRQARQRAQVFVEEQEVIQEAVQGAQTKALSPEKMEEALEAAAVTSDGSSVLAQSVYIPPQAALDLMNQGTDILTPLGITVEEAQDAATKDVDLEVKQSALQARLDVDQVSEVLQIMRETPDAPSLMDVLGSQDIEAEEMLAAVEEAKSRKRKLDAVRKEEMRLIGEMTPLMGNQVAHQQARLLVAHANAAAQSYGVDPATVLERYHVKRGSEGAASANAAGEVLDQTAYHGSPHRFDSFSTEHIGSGEGAQAHGWGLYFAQDKKVSDDYRRRLSNMNEQGTTFRVGSSRYMRRGDGSYVTASGKQAKSHIQLALDYFTSYNQDVQETLRVLEEDAAYSSDGRAALDWMRKNGGKLKTSEAGQLFKVDVPENDVLLDEQLTLREQPEKVRDAVLRLYHGLTEEQLAPVRQDIAARTRERAASPEIAKASREHKLLVRRVEDIQYLNANKVRPPDTRDLFADNSGFQYDITRESLGKWYTPEEVDRIQMDDAFAAQELEKHTARLQELAELVESDRQARVAERDALRAAAMEQDVDGLVSGMTGEYLYSYLSLALGGPQNASMALNDAGVKGVTYVGETDGRCFVVFDDKAVDVMRTFYQGGTSGAPVRAQADLATGVIRLFRGADLSSLSHESAHLFVQELGQIAQDDGSIARERLRSDLEQTQIDSAPFAGLLDGTMNTADARAMLRDVRSELAGLDERVQRVRDQLKEARVNARRQARRKLPEDQQEAAAVRNDQEMAQTALESLVRIQEMDAQDRRRLLASERLLAQYVRNMDGLEQAREDMRTLRRFAGVPEEGPLSDDQYKAMQEYAARGFEQYVSEGRAPSAELEGFFSRMMRWLKNLYASWRSYVGAELSDDVRRVYDRMLSADVQAQTDPDIDAMLGREEDFLLETDLTDDERSYLEDLRTRAGAEATAKMDRAVLRERNRRYREAYTSAREILKEDPFWVSVFEFTRQRGKKNDTNGINKESLAEYLGEEQASELAKKMPMLVNAKNTGFPVDTMAQFAESHGYGDGDADAMANKLYERLVLDGQTFNKACQEFAEAQLEQEDARDIPSEEVLAGDSYGQYLEEMENALHRMDQELSEEGELKHLRRTTREQADRLERLENRLGRQIESQARKAERQIESLQGRLGRQAEELRERRKAGRELAARNRTLERHETVRERARRLEKRAMPESWYRSLARKEVAELPINKLGNGRFVASLRRALSERSRAARRGDYVAAAKAMQRARYAFAMMQEAKRARDEVASIEKRMRRAARVKNGTYPAVQTEALRKLGEALGLIGPRAPWDAEAAKMSFRKLVAQAAGDTTVIDVMPMFANWVLDLQNPDVMAAAKGKALVWGELNLMEAQEVGNVLDFLVHSAREQSKTNKESLRAQVEEIAGKAAQAMESLPTYYAPARDTPKDRIMKGWTSIDTIDWECRKADGFQHVPGRKDSTAGPMEIEIYGRLRKAMDAYHERLNGTYKSMAPHVVHLLESAKALEQKYGKKTLKVRDESGRLVRIPDALVRDGQKGWTADQLFAMALNLGNAGNRERLRESFKNEKGEDGLDFNLVSTLLGDDAAAALFEMSDAQRAEATRGRAERDGLLSEQDWLAIQGIWDVLGTQWPDTQAAHKKLYGFAPQGVELEPLMIRVGGRTLELKGGYYPIRYDRRLDLKTRELGSTEDILDRTEGLIGVPPSAKKGHTMKRVDHTGRSLLLDVASVLQRHLIDSARFIELGYDVRFADRVIQSASFASQYQRAFGIHDYDRIRPNLKGLVVDEVAPQDELFQFAELLRKHLTYYALGGNIKVAVMQLTAVWPAAGDIGYGEVLGGLGQLMTRGAGLVRDVWAASPYMERRYRNIDEDLSRKAMDFKPGRLSVIRNGRVYTWDDLANLSMLPIAVADTVVTTAIWTGAYHKRLSELQKKSAAWKLDLESEYHADAVAYADSVIAQSNPDNDVLSKSAFARSKGVARLFNAFSGATTKFAQRTRYTYQGWRAGRITGKEFARMEAHDMLLPALSMVFMLGLAQGLMSGGDEDTEELLKLLGSTTLGQAAMAVPIFGNPCADALTALFGAGTRRAGLSTALNTPFEMAGRSAAAWSDLDGQKMFTTTLDIASYVTRVPVGPVARRTVRGVEQWQEGEGTPFSVFMPRSGQ